MDMFHDASIYEYQSDKTPPSHFEYMAVLNHPDSITKVKYQAFMAMASLEGWCTQNKASLLIDLILMADPQVVVEIGVWGGKSLIPMAYALKENGAGKIYGIDPWSAIESIQGMDGVNKEWWGSVNHQQILDGLIQKINQFGLRDQIELIRKTSANAEPIYDIGLLHIDGNHSEESSYLDVVKWVPLVKKGGIIIFDDVNWTSTGKAVKWLDDNCIRFAQVKNENIWGAWVKP